MSTSVPSAKKSKQSILPNTQVSHKVARNLKQEFDQYSLNDEYSFQNKSNPTPIKKIDLSMQSILKPNHHTNKIQKQNNNIRESKQQQVYKVPKSYLMGMKSLQEALEKKEEYVEELKDQLLRKEEYIYECQARVNEYLRKCQQYKQSVQKKQLEIQILKTQNAELRIDKDIVIRQTAKAIEGEYKIQTDPIIQRKLQRSKTTHHSNAMNPTALSGFSNPLEDTHQPKNLNIHHQNFTMHGISPLLSHRPQQNNFISYQRQILRGQKQLIALKYRMECLQRKLLSPSGNIQEIKHKIRKLSEQISIKQLANQNLKKFI